MGFVAGPWAQDPVRQQGAGRLKRAEKKLRVMLMTEFPQVESQG